MNQINKMKLLKECILDNNIQGVKKCLEEFGDDVHADDYDGDIGLYDLLYLAIRKENIDIVKMLFNIKPDKNYMSLAENKFLTIAIEVNNKEIVNLLIDKGINLDAKNVEGSTALHFCARTKDKIDFIDLLLENGADVNAKNKVSNSALMIALRFNMVENAKKLIENGANVNAENNHYTALAYVVQENKLELIKLLIDAGADVNYYGKSEKIPLILASKNGNYEIVELLINSGADLSVRDKNWNSALHHACFQDKEDMTVLLLKNGADVNYYGENGNTALHGAIKLNLKSMVRLLMKHGADLKLTDAKDKSSFELMVEKKWAIITHSKEKGYVFQFIVNMD